MTAAAEAEPVDVLLGRWGPFLRGRAARVARWRRVDPDEVLAEATARVVQHFPRFDPKRAGFSAWVVYLIRSAAADLARERRQEPRAAHVGDAGEPLDGLPDRRSQDPAKVVADAEARRVTSAAVARAVADLPDDQKAAIEARFWGDGGARMTAAGNSALWRALGALRESLADVGEGGR